MTILAMVEKKKRKNETDRRSALFNKGDSNRRWSLDPFPVFCGKELASLPCVFFSVFFCAVLVFMNFHQCLFFFHDTFGKRENQIMHELEPKTTSRRKGS